MKPRRRTIYLCQIGCDVDCTHGHTCIVGGFGGIDRDHPHPTRRGREHHYAMSGDGMMHEWTGRAGRCAVYEPDEPESS